MGMAYELQCLNFSGYIAFAPRKGPDAWMQTTCLIELNRQAVTLVDTSACADVLSKTVLLNSYL